MLFLDSYFERVPAAASVGLRLAAVERCDYVLVGHSHFDHLWGAAEIAHQSGATVIGSYETVRMLDRRGSPELASAWRCRGANASHLVVTSRPASSRAFTPVCGAWRREASAIPPWRCTATSAWTCKVRERRVLESFSAWGDNADVVAHLGSGPHARGDGGALVYLIETRHGSVLWQDTAGCWTAHFGRTSSRRRLVGGRRPPQCRRRALSGIAGAVRRGRGRLLQAGRVALCHHDDWMPPVTGAYPDRTVRSRAGAPGAAGRVAGARLPRIAHLGHIACVTRVVACSDRRGSTVSSGGRWRPPRPRAVGRG